MKKLYTSIICALVGLIMQGQCTADYNWGAQTFGISPNPSLGENFVPGFQGEPYSDIFYIKTPVNAASIDPSQPNALTANSMHLDSILYGVVVNGSTVWSNISDLGLSLICNNNGENSDPCFFSPGSVYCSEITGIPNQIGVFPVKVMYTINFILIGNVQFELNNNATFNFSESNFPPGCNDPICM